MTNLLNKPIIRYGVIFSLIPMISTYLIGHLFKLLFSDTVESAAVMPADDPERMFFPQVDYIFPFAILCGVLAFCIWVTFMKKKPSQIKGAIAGLTTVFLAYPTIGFAAGLIYPDPISSHMFSAIDSSVGLALFGNFFTFWITYPLGAICGFIIAERMFKHIKSTVTPTVFE